MRPVSSRLAAIAIGGAVLSIPLVYLPGTFDFTLHPRLFLLQGFLLIALVAWAATHQPSENCPSPQVLPLLVTTGMALLSVFWAVNPVEGLIQISRSFTFLVLGLISAYALSPGAIRNIYATGAVAGAVVSGIGIAQYFGWAFADIPTVGNPSSTFGYRNFAASYLVLSIPCTIAFAWTSRYRLAQMGWFASGTLMMLFLIYTRTRGAWLGFSGALLAGIVLAVYLRLKYEFGLFRGVHAVARSGICIGCLIIVFLGAFQSARMQQEGKFRFDERKTDALTTLTTSFSPGDARGRLTVWRHTLEMVVDHPLLGVGLGSWQYVYPLYDRGDWITDNVAPQRPHNDLLWMLAETGVLGLGAYLWLLCTLGTGVWNALKHHASSTKTLWMFGIALGLLAFVGHSCFSFPRERIAPSAMFWLGSGVLLRLAAEQRPRLPAVRQRLFFRCTLGLAAVLLLGGLLLTYRHMRFDMHYLQAYGAWRQQAWEQVSAQADMALQFGPLNHRVLLLKGFAHQQLGHDQDAANAYTTSLKYHPNEGHGALASTYTQMGMYQRAIDHYRTEAALFPASPVAAFDLANGLTRTGEWAEAALAYEKTLKLAPQRRDAQLALANVYERLKQWDRALEIYQNALEDTPSVDIYTRMGQIHQAADNLQGALEAFARAQELAPNSPKSHNNLGVLYTRLGRIEDAEKAYLRALRIHPDYARAHHNLGDLYRATGRKKQAIAAYGHFIRTWSGDTRMFDLVRRKIQELKGTH